MQTLNMPNGVGIIFENENTVFKYYCSTMVTGLKVIGDKSRIYIIVH